MNEAKINVGGQWFYRGNSSFAWFATFREGGGLADRLEPHIWPLLEEIARLRSLDEPGFVRDAKRWQQFRTLDGNYIGQGIQMWTPQQRDEWIDGLSAAREEA